MSNTIANMATELLNLKALKKTIDDDLKVIVNDIDRLTKQIMNSMDEQETSSMSLTNIRKRLGINKNVYPQLQDFSEFTDWLLPQLRDHPEYISFFQKRLSSTAYKELVELTGEVPGIVPFTKRTLSITAI